MGIIYRLYIHIDIFLHLPTLNSLYYNTFIYFVKIAKIIDYLI
jgi:hypothetical protein